MTKRKPPSPVSPGPLDDSLIPYSTRAFKKRLEWHALTEDFVAHLFVASGGPLKEEDGGSWERMRRASAFLRQREQRAPMNDRKRLVSKISRLERDRRNLLDAHARSAGITHHYDSPALTTGEVAYFSRLCDWIEIADIDDIVECITTAFPGTGEIPPPVGLRAATAEGADDAPSAELSANGEAPPKKRKLVRVLEDDLVLPEGYLDGADVSGTKDEVLERMRMHLHRHLVAEIEGKNRRGVTDWIIGKLAGWKVPEEWRVAEEEAA